MDNNYFRNPKPWTEIHMAGRLIRSALVELNDVSTEDEWKKQKSKETSGSVNSFSGTKQNNFTMTFEGVDENDFDDLGDLWNALAPVPGLGGGTTSATTAAPMTAPGQPSATAVAVGNAAAAESKASGGDWVDQWQARAAAQTDSSSSALDSVNADTGKDTSKEPSPGPRPPTVAVDHPLLRWHGITAAARKKWEGPFVTETNSVRVKLTMIPDKPPTPAGTGAMAPPKPGSQFTIGGGGGSGGGTTSSQDAIGQHAAADAAGT